jgi:acyl CoA:acetate/3-ketoacid CoA transferase alpha subunit
MPVLFPSSYPGITPGPLQVQRWSDALLAAQVLAAGAGLIGGVRLRAGAGPVRDRWLEMARAMIDAKPAAGGPGSVSLPPQPPDA